MNGLYSLIKYGFSSCEEGVGHSRISCHGQDFVEGSFDISEGRVAYRPPEERGADALVDELATLLTGGRLSRDHRKAIKSAYKETKDPAAALRRAQQLIVSSPEFHATGLVRNSRELKREEFRKAEPSGRPYKAIVFLMLRGGADSYNMVSVVKNKMIVVVRIAFQSSHCNGPLCVLSAAGAPLSM